MSLPEVRAAGSRPGWTKPGAHHCTAAKEKTSGEETMQDQRNYRVPALITAFFLYLPFLYISGFKLVHARPIDFPSFYWGAKVAFSGALPYGPSALEQGELLLHQIVFPY